MSRRVLGLNVLLAAISLACLAYAIAATGLTPAAPASRPRPAAPTRPSAPTVVPPPRPTSQGYALIATKNLFSPTRTEATETAAVPTTPTFKKPSLYGVVLRDGAPIAYLEDPVTRRVAGYRPGDSIAGGIVQTMTADRVVIVRPDGKVDVLLHDPTRPAAQAPPQPATAPNLIRRLPRTSPDAPPR